MKVAIIGHFALSKEYNDGQTVKVRNLYSELVKLFGEDEVFRVDTYNYKSNPTKLLKNCVQAMKADYVLFLPAQNGVKVFVPLFCFLNKFYNKNLFYVVVGGWLPEMLKINKSLLKDCKNLTKILVETEGMKSKLNSLGLDNVDILFNFKDIKPISKNELKNLDYSQLKVCTFSRVIKSKGIENAINVVNSINKKYGKTIYNLDIYGPIGDDYKEEFQDLISKTGHDAVNYKGVIDSSKSVDTIKNYDLLLFPTYYEGEGLAGTIIDAFFAGVPVVASDWKYNKDIIKDGVNGLIFKTKCDEEFETILENVYLKKYDILSMKHACLEEAEKYVPDIAIKGLTKYINAPKRTLCIVSSMNRGGAETFLMKVYRALDKGKYQMDFGVTEPGEYDKEIESLGGRIYFIPAKSKNLFKSFSCIKKIVKSNRYNSVLRTSQQSLATIDLIAAKRGGAKKLIYRSSNSGLTNKGIGSIVNKIFSILPKIVPNLKIAPSTEAAEFVFGKNSVKKGKVSIVPNGIDYSLFKFSNEKREELRDKLNLKEKTVVGHVGRFNRQKNHEFLLDVFNEMHKKDKNCYLLLIGKGELEKNIRQKIGDLGLNDFVTIIEPVANINEYYMAMDVLVFPSFFEGMPNVIIEAQASDLPCVVSDNITKEANISGKLIYKDISSSPKEWADVALNLVGKEREDNKIIFSKNGYILTENIDKYVEFMF